MAGDLQQTADNIAAADQQRTAPGHLQSMRRGSCGCFANDPAPDGRQMRTDCMAAMKAGSPPAAGRRHLFCFRRTCPSCIVAGASEQCMYLSGQASPMCIMYHATSPGPTSGICRLRYAMAPGSHFRIADVSLNTNVCKSQKLCLALGTCLADNHTAFRSPLSLHALRHEASLLNLIYISK